MKRLLVALLVLLLMPGFVLGQQTHNTMPGANATFISDLQTFLGNESPNRYNDIFVPLVVSGGLGATAAGLTHTPTALTAYPGGYYATETAAITYPNNVTCWVVATYTTTSTLIGSFSRVAGTKYATDCVSATQPTLPANSVILMKVVTAAGAITNVTDLRVLSPISTAQLPTIPVNKGGTGTTATLSGYLKGGSPITAQATPLPAADGGLGAALPASGYLKGGASVGSQSTPLPVADLGTGTPSASNFLRGDGAWATPTNNQGAYNVRNLVGINDSGAPNTKYGFSADLITVRNPSTGVIATIASVSTVTCNLGVTGANGLDTGTQGASTWYHFYAIYNGSVIACLASTVAPMIGPTLPGGYTSWAYVGAVYSDGSTHLLMTYMRGSREIYQGRQTALNNGKATVETAVSLATFVPPNALTTMLNVMFPASTGQEVKLRVVTGVDWADNLVANAAASWSVVPNVSQQIFYIFTVGPTNGLTIDVAGFSVPNGGD